MKKTLILLLSAMTLFASVSCGGNTETSDSLKETHSSQISESLSADFSDDGSASEGAYVCEFESGTVIALGKALPELGEYLSYAEAASCIHPGMDKVYTYDGFTVTTSPDADGNDLVSEIALESDTVSLKNGIKIGCDKSVVVSVFGENYTENFGVMKYESAETVISAVLDDSSAVVSFVISAVQ